MIEAFITMILVFSFFICVFLTIILLLVSKKNFPKPEKSEKEYEKPQFKELTKKQVEDIHSRGKLTPEEKVTEWENLGLCAPGDAIGSAGYRCEKFNYCCHDCLVDYANNSDEYTPFAKLISTSNTFFDQKEDDP